MLRRVLVTALISLFAPMAHAEPPPPAARAPQSAPANPPKPGAQPVAPKPPATAPAQVETQNPPAKNPAGEKQPPVAKNVDKNGVVSVEQGGHRVALGVVLNGDGRVLTALSRLNPQAQLTVRYANDTTELARVGYSDAARDLALLVPRTARWQKGLPAARSISPATAALSTVSVGQNRTLTPVEQPLSGATTVSGHTFLKLESPPKTLELGAPLLNDQGEVAALVVSGCVASVKKPCTEPPLGIPIGEVREFLRARPVDAGFALPRLGVSGTAADNGAVRGLWITQIEPQSPAATLGLRSGTDSTNADVLVAIAGTPVTTPNALRAELSRHAPGDRVELLVFGKDGYRMVAVRLAAPAPTAKPPAATGQNAAGTAVKSASAPPQNGAGTAAKPAAAAKPPALTKPPAEAPKAAPAPAPAHTP